MIKVFCYGSLNQKMIELLIGEKLAMAPVPGVLENHVRIFVGYSEFWSGAVASLYHCAGESVYGAVVNLTREQFEKIEEYEGGYNKVKRLVRLSDDKRIFCHMFEIKDPVFSGSLPSEKYLKSIRTTLNDIGLLKNDPVNIYSVFAYGDKHVLARIMKKV